MSVGSISMGMSDSEHSLRLYAVAAAAVAAAWLVRWLLEPITHFRVPYATFFVAVAFAGWRGGLGPALLALALGGAAALWSFVPPDGTFAVETTDDLVGLAFYATSGSLIAGMSHAMHRAEASARASAETARVRQRELERENAERRRAEVEARSQREWFRITLGSIGDGVIATDTNANVTFLNPVAERLTGWTLANAQGCPLRSVFSIVNEHTRAEVANPVEIALREGRVVGLANHTVLIARDGSERAIDDSAAPICDEQGRVTGVVLIFRDVTERRRREREGAYLAAIVSSSDDAIYGKTLEGVITSWNAGAERLYGWQGAEIVGRHVSVLTPSDRHDEIERIMGAVRDGKKVEHFETVRRRKDGTSVHVSLTISPIRSVTGELVGASSVARDATARMELEQELRRSADALRDADRRKDEFLATLAHELRNPLAPIRNALEILRVAAGDPERLERARAMMDRQVQQMVRLIDDLLDVSRISSGRIALRKERIELGTAIESAIETSRPVIESSGHQLDVEIAAEPLWVDGDLTRLSQVFANLLNNAAKYTDRGRIWLRAVREGDRAAVYVRDTGVGIAPDALPFIFEMFSQVDRSLERTQGGLGIGLSLVRALVELHGGMVDAHSDGPGAGSEFVVRLPLAAKREAVGQLSTGDGDGRRGPTAGRRILVVDDNRDSADSLAIMLDLSGNETRTEYDGAAALEAARIFSPHVVLLDIGLPGLNGYEVASRIRAEPWGRAMLLVAMTGWGQDDDKQRALRAGFDLHMTKPIDHTALEKVLSTHAQAAESATG